MHPAPTAVCGEGNGRIYDPKNGKKNQRVMTSNDNYALDEVEVTGILLFSKTINQGSENSEAQGPISSLAFDPNFTAV
ncbi:MAG: hypothetical protein ACK57D_03330 [Sphingobacteriales bacterium]